MIGPIRVRPEHGSREVTVRGRVSAVRPSTMGEHFVGWLLQQPRDVAEISIDHGPFRSLNKILTLEAGAAISQTFAVSWNFDQKVPPVGLRVWLTFGYTPKNEWWSSGSPRLSVKEVTPIDDEKKTFRGEVFTGSEFPQAA